MFSLLFTEKWPEERAKKVVVSSVDTSATIAGLRPVTTYHIYVSARNAIGQSLPSAELAVTTNAEGMYSCMVHFHSVYAFYLVKNGVLNCEVLKSKYCIVKNSRISHGN